MELKEYINPLLRWWWLILIATVVAGAFSFIAVSQEPPTYRSSATLMIGRAMSDPNPDYFDITLSQSLASTYADIATREPVRQATKEALGLTWLPNYSVRAVPNTQLLEIIVTDVDPVRTQAVANELSEQLIRQSPVNQEDNLNRQGFINQQLDDLETKIQQTQEEIEGRQKELSNLISARQIADVQGQIGALQTKLDTLQYNYVSLLNNSPQGALNSLMVIEPAPLPLSPVGPNVILTVTMACFFAAVIALGVVYMLNFLDNTVKSPEEVKKISGLAVLAGIPNIEGESYTEKLITVNDPRSPTSEAYRSLRTGLQFSVIDLPRHTAVMVTSPRPSDGKTITAANLAVVLAQAGNKVLLLDGDLRRPSLHKLFELSNRTGLTDIYHSLSTRTHEGSIDETVEQYTKATSIEGLSIITSGPLPPNPSELLGSKFSKLLLEILKITFDYIVIDTPPTLVVTDSIVLSTKVDGVLVIIDANKTPRNQLKECIESLKEVNATLLGVVVNRLTIQTGGYASYRRYYYYRQTYGKGYSYHNPDSHSRSNGHWAAGLKGLFRRESHSDKGETEAGIQESAEESQ